MRKALTIKKKNVRAFFLDSVINSDYIIDKEKKIMKLEIDEDVRKYLDFHIDNINGFYKVEIDKKDKNLSKLIQQVDDIYKVQKKRKNKRTSHYEHKWEAVLCEVMFGYMLPSSEYKDQHDCDYKINGKKIDVKSKHCRAYPKVTHECSVHDYLLKSQDTDYFAFMFSANMKKLTQVWFCGFISKQRYINESFVLKKGDNFLNGNKVAKATTYNVYCYQLISPTQLDLFS